MTKGTYGKRGMLNPRLDVILDALDGGRVVAVADLARQLNVAERTVRRDLEALRDIGHNIGWSGGAGGDVIRRG